MTTWFFARSGMIAPPVPKPYGNPNKRHRTSGLVSFWTNFAAAAYTAPAVDARRASISGGGPMGWWIVLGLIVVAIVYAVMLYNGLVTVENNVSLAWANIDVLLKQRHDEIPKLVEICKQYR